MVATAFTEVGISTMMKAAMRRGLSQFMFMNTGIRFSSPTMSAPMTDLTSAFTLLLAVFCSMEKLECRLRSSQAKGVGTVVSVAGALIVTLYKGLPVTGVPSESSSLNQLLFSSNWVTGGIFCAAGALCLSLLYIVQTWILKDCPAELMITCISCSLVTLLSTIVGLIAEKDLNVWMLKPDVGLIAIMCSAVFAVSIRGVVHTWSCGVKGPLYTAMFNPLGMIIATFVGVSFLEDTLYLGSVIGGIIIAVDFILCYGEKPKKKRWLKQKDIMILSHRTLLKSLFSKIKI
ncbi:conserved hypothetical protein [Ricinus communis]|uniref:WAT1-related protein n=1 Tax=Ricinus communis TaxID=3988 RepID=B9SZH0_RICCO|nr:conserved hypothetical protein [Ricinus communis]